jgi:hypothetical protein
MLHQTRHYFHRLAWWGADADAWAFLELREAACQACRAYARTHLTTLLAGEGCAIILPAGSGAALGQIYDDGRRIVFVACTYVPWRHLASNQRDACHLVRRALRLTSRNEQDRLFAAARCGTRRWWQ